MANGMVLEAPGARLVKLDGQKQIPLTPVFTNEVFFQLEKLIEKALQPLSVEIAEDLCSKLEEMFFPLIRKGEPRLVEDFYTFNLKNFIHSSSTLWWYGLNGEGDDNTPLELPAKDVGYEHYAAGLYLILLN